MLGDPDITVDFFPTEFEEFFGVLLTSPKFESMVDAERQDSVWDYLRSDHVITNEDLFYVSQIGTETEAIELI